MSGFDRIRPPDRRRGEGSPAGTRAADPAGRAALFSAGAAPPATPATAGPSRLALHCSRCGRASPLDARTAVQVAFPLFLVVPCRRQQVFAVCPACRRRAWLRVGR